MARARYIDAKHTPSYTGQLHLSTSGSFSDHDQMFAVGYLEGYISAGWLQKAYIHIITSNAAPKACALHALGNHPVPWPIMR